MPRQSQINTGLRSILSAPRVYNLAMRLIRNNKHYSWFVDEVLRLQAGQRMIDIGCGPASILSHIPDVSYVGLDISDAYIEAARDKWGARGTFVAGSIEAWLSDHRIRDADLVLINGVLHHTDDDMSRKLLHLGKQALKPAGRLVCYEPCYLIFQSAFSRSMMALDRGQHIRNEQQWKDLADSVLSGASTAVVADVNRLGYTCILIEFVEPAFDDS